MNKKFGNDLSAVLKETELVEMIEDDEKDEEMVVESELKESNGILILRDLNFNFNWEYI